MTEESISPAISISKVIRDARSRKYKTIKIFFDEHGKNLQISYPHYSAVETGKKFPDIELALRIAQILKIDLRLICHVWARDQMPTPATRAFFEPIAGLEVKGVPAALHQDLDNFYIIQDHQIEGLKKHPIAWDVVMFILAASDEQPPTESEIGKALSYPIDEVRDAVEWLRNESMVISESGKLKTRKRFFHIPNTEAFKDFRDANFKRTTEHLVNTITPQQLADKTAYRTTYMRRITPTQAQEISKQIDSLIGHLGNMDDTGDDLYALTIGFGIRANIKKQEKKK